MPSWNDLGNIWGTLRELDVNAIGEEADRPLFLACVGDAPLLDDLATLLHRTDNRYPGVGIDPLGRYGVPIDASASADLDRADLLVLVLDARQPVSAGVTQAFSQLERRSLPLVVVLLYGAALPSGAGLLSSAHSVAIPDPHALAAADTLAKALLDRLPGELHLAAARRLPGLRATVARELIGSVSFTNATYALASGLPEQIPILNVPFAATDMLVLTKNQALLVYRLALAYGAPVDFQARIKEVLPVVGGAFVWRQLARGLVGLIPIWGLVPKIAVSYAGTYSTGVAAWRWYESGDLVNSEQLKRISQDALAIGRERARELISGRKQQDGETAKQPGMFGRLAARVRGMLPGGKHPPALPEPQKNQE